ncbi:MAG: CocE/NonD family hydrolase [Brachymonas sp.]|nr:CocE/NonD family hydrolase [Brachymonas sp.]
MPGIASRYWRSAVVFAAAGLSWWLAPAAFAQSATNAAGHLACREATPAEAAIYSSPVMMPGVISPKDGTCFINNAKVTASDGVQLLANVFLPKDAAQASAQGAKLPTVVFITSWACAEFFEYLGAQHNMARKGYIAMSYTARGFWNSGGVIGVANTQDVGDVSSAIDWVLKNTPADVTRIGASGISYGAGLSMLAAAKDVRIKAVTAMSGWANLADQLYANAVPNTTWLDMLMGLGKITGRMDPQVLAMGNMVKDPNTTQAQATDIIHWTRDRSPSHVVDVINARQVPVFISKNWQDHMFTPNSSMDMFTRLTGPKQLMLQPGIHGSAELPGAIFGTPNPIYAQAERWFDRWLKGEPNGIDAEPKVKLRPTFSKTYESLSNWPAPELKQTVYQINPRDSWRWDFSCFCFKGDAGSLSATADAVGVNTINNGLDTVASTGVPIVSPVSEAIGAPVLTLQNAILLNQGIRYEGPVLEQGLKIRGIPSIKLSVRPSQQRGMLVAYLYSVNAQGWGTLITHGARAVHWATPNALTDFSFQMNAAAFDVPAGNKLALVFDTKDSLYGDPVKFGESFAMSLQTGGGTASLTIPSR